MRKILQRSKFEFLNFFNEKVDLNIKMCHVKYIYVVDYLQVIPADTRTRCEICSKLTIKIPE